MEPMGRVSAVQGPDVRNPLAALPAFFIISLERMILSATSGSPDDFDDCKPRSLKALKTFYLNPVKPTVLVVVLVSSVQKALKSIGCLGFWVWGETLKSTASSANRAPSR